MRLSSKGTFYLKFLHPWILAAVLLGLSASFNLSQSIAVWLYLALVAVAVTMTAVACVPLKNVWFENGTLRVSNFRKTDQVRSAEIVEVARTGWKRRFITLQLSQPCAFGQRITFIPPLSEIIKESETYRRRVQDLLKAAG